MHLLKHAFAFKFYERVQYIGFTPEINLDNRLYLIYECLFALVVNDSGRPEQSERFQNRTTDA